MKRLVKKTFYPYEQNKRPYFWHPLSVAIIAAFVLLASGFLLTKDENIKENTLLGDIKSGVIIALTNEKREKADLPQLTESAVLNTAATLKAQDMASKGYFAHYSPAGISPWYWFTKAGYSYKKAGENLAVNFKDSDDIVRAWMNSPTHKANIVKEGYTEIGIGIAEGVYQGKKATFVVQLFAAPQDVQQNLFAFSIEKKLNPQDGAQQSIQGAEITVFSTASIFEVFSYETYVFLALLFIISILIVIALVILFMKGRNYTKRFYISLIILLAALAISILSLLNFFGTYTISFF